MRVKSARSMYAKGRLWCGTEEKWVMLADSVMRGRGAYCPSCGSRLRAKPRSGNKGASSVYVIRDPAVAEGLRAFQRRRTTAIMRAARAAKVWGWHT